MSAILTLLTLHLEDGRKRDRGACVYVSVVCVGIILYPLFYWSRAITKLYNNVFA